MPTKTYVAKRRVSYGKADENGKMIVKPKDYEEGDPIELEDADAKPLLAVDAIEPETKGKK